MDNQIKKFFQNIKVAKSNEEDSIENLHLALQEQLNAREPVVGKITAILEQLGRVIFNKRKK